MQPDREPALEVSGTQHSRETNPGWGFPFSPSECNWGMLGTSQFPEVTARRIPERAPRSRPRQGQGELTSPACPRAKPRPVAGSVAAAVPWSEPETRWLGTALVTVGLRRWGWRTGSPAPGHGCGLPGVRLLWAGGLQAGGWAAPCTKPEGSTSEAWAKLAVTPCPCESQVRRLEQAAHG